MNERIEQLAEKAGYHPDVYNLCKEGLDKFAELIIQECADIAFKNTPDYEDLDYGHLISDKIKHYFGIKNA